MNEDAILSDVLGKLEGVRSQAGYWMARCPAHEDSKASLSVARGTEQPVIIKCHAGCDPVDILAAVGLTLADVSTPREEQETRAAGIWTPYGHATDVYSYTDEDGTVLYQVLRAPNKQFPVRVPDPARKSGWRWSLGDTRRVLYRLPALRAAIEAGEFIWVVEGEKDVHALERTGNIATCNPGGAGKWRAEYSEVLRDAIVMIVADADKPGRAHARAVAKSLAGIAAAVEIQEAAEGKDVSDHLAAGRSLAELVITNEGDVDAGPELATDLVVFVKQSDPPEQWVIPNLIERGDRIIWTGAPGLGKTMVTRQIAVATAAGVHPFKLHQIPAKKVLFIDCENRIPRSRRKFRDLVGACTKMHFPLQPGMFHIVHRPAGIDVTRADDAEFVLEQVTAHKPDLLVIGPLYKLHAIDANEELSAKAITHVLDLALGISESALLVEAHAPHGDVLRPAGSGLFMRWPDFGYGMRPANPKDPRFRERVKVTGWRGPRDDYGWPEDLIWGNGKNEFPWVVPTAERRTLGRTEDSPGGFGLDRSHPDP